MLEIPVTFDEFQLVFHFMLFFTLTLFFQFMKNTSQQKSGEGAAGFEGFFTELKLRKKK